LDGIEKHSAPTFFIENNYIKNAATTHPINTGKKGGGESGQFEIQQTTRKFWHTALRKSISNVFKKYEIFPKHKMKFRITIPMLYFIF